MSGISGHIADRAGFIAALSTDDPERKLAEEHAHCCAMCREALEEGKRLVSLLAEALPMPAPTPDALDRAAAAIEKETLAERRSSILLRWTLVGAVIAGWVLQLVYSKHLTLNTHSVTVSLAVLAVAVLSVAVARSRHRVALGVVIGTSAVFAYLIGSVTALEPRIGFECTACELVAAVIPWLTLTVLAWRRRVPLDRANTMAAAAAGALASQAGQLIGCPVGHSHPHLLVFHFGGVLLALALGAVNLVSAPRLARVAAAT